MKIEMVAKSDVGMVREFNEDYCGVFEKEKLAVLCDGMGGHKAGAQASRLAVSTIRYMYIFLDKQTHGKITADLDEVYCESAKRLVGAIRLANRYIYNKAHKQVSYKGMGTTASALAFEAGIACIAHVGDSRIYRIRNGQIKLLTEDHSWINELIQDNEIKKEDALQFGKKNVITRALGLAPTVKIDLKLEPIKKGDIFLLCSDGLTKSLSDEKIKQIVLFNQNNLQHALTHLIDSANMADGSDNITVLLVRVIEKSINSKALLPISLTLKSESDTISSYENKILKRELHRKNFGNATNSLGLRKYAKILLWIILLIIAIFIVSKVTFAKTIVNGIQSGIWNLKDSPYIVTDDIIVPKGLALTINPGVIVKFSGPFRFIVAGALIAKGTWEDRIIFTSNYDNEKKSQIILPSNSDWYGIDFSDSSDDYLSIIKYCIIRYCKFGIRCHKAYPLLTDIIFADIAENAVVINDHEVDINVGVDFDYLTDAQRPSIVPLPEPPPESEAEKKKRAEKKRLEALQKAKQDSIRIANKIKPADTRSGILIFDARDIDDLGFFTFPEILSFFAGFINMASYWEGSEVSCRGIFPGQFNNRILYLLDGIPIYEGITNSSYFEFIPLKAVERIELSRGPDGAFFGENAFSAIVNIILKKSSQPLQMLTNIRLGSFYSQEISSYIGFKRRPFNICIGNSFRDDNGYYRTINSDELSNKFKLNYENDNYNLLIGLQSENLNIIGSYYKQQKYQFGIVPIQQYSGLAEKKGLLLNLYYSKRLSKNFSGDLKARYNYSFQQSNAQELGSDLTNTEPPNFTLSEGYLFHTEAKINYVSPKFLTLFGFSIEHEKANNILSLLDEKDGDILGGWGIVPHPSINEISFFTQMGYNFSPFVGFVNGLRWSYLGKGSSYFISPTFKLIYNPFASYNIQLSYRHGYRSPSLWERQIQVPDILYSPQKLIPEQIRTAEIVVDYDINGMGKLGLSGYWESISNLIYQRNLTSAENIKYHAATGYIYDNMNEDFQVVGGEIDFQGKASTMLLIFINGAYQYFKDNNNLPYWPKITSNLGITYRSNSSLTSSINLQYIGKQTKDETTIVITPSYLLNMKIALNLLPRVSLEFIGNNLFNKECFYAEFSRQKIPVIPGGYPRAFFLLLKTQL